MRAAAFLSTLVALASDRIEARSERGATAVEYGLLVGLIAVVIIVAVALLGTQLEALFGKLTTALTDPSGKGAAS
ncbi:Flp family type IVb pilin [Brachybacterium vulturis]|uniref:Flp family type IVb pilin n=1 Tax=Brachybacterium vulturis TaxID=2017484 RepID=A0A291GNV8_9MICO|nr:Flp family type IVb pilin [Brachybacterium vulturis]ATG51868.1 Flp family type IVb pilin [Brachybacterium vulturis]